MTIILWDVEQAGRLGTAAAGLVIIGLDSDVRIVNLKETISFMKSASVQI